MAINPPGDPGPESPTPYSPELEAHIWRRYRVPGEKLRCGILLPEDRSLESWAMDTLELLQKEPAISIVALFRIGAAAHTGSGSPAALFRRLDAWSSRSAAPCAQPESGRLKTITGLGPQMSSGVLSLEESDRIAAHRLDVLIWLDSRPLPLDCANLAGFGLWSIRPAAIEAPVGYPPYCCEVFLQNPVSGVTLQQHMSQETIRNLGCCVTATERGLRFTQNAVGPLWIAAPLLIRRLLDLAENRSSLDGLPLMPASQASILSPPGNLRTALFLARQAARSAYLRSKARGRSPFWFLAVRSDPRYFRTAQERFSPGAFRDIPLPGFGDKADPFVVEDAGRHWLFFEDQSVPDAPARLSCLELRTNGEFGEPFVVIEKPYHMSYPFVIRQGSDWFLLPETSANQTVELYRATRFPTDWTLEKVLVSGVSTVDTTPFFLDGKWYFFTSPAHLDTQSYLFWADRLDGEWHYHPRNPISSDVRNARCAGALFRHGSEWIRPSQNSALGYGHSMTLNRVLRLSPSEYREEAIETISPTWRKGLLGTHTINSNSAFEVIDGRRFC